MADNISKSDSQPADAETIMIREDSSGMVSPASSERIPVGGGMPINPMVDSGISGSTAESSVVMDGVTLPETIGHYKVLEFIAKGGMGLVLRAEHTTLGRMAALKVMRPELQGDAMFVDRFLREAKLAASVEHQNIVPVYDAALESGCLYMAMRHVPGGHLGGLIQQRGALQEVEALDILIQCAQGLEAIHEAGLIHRDIKPSNILINEKGRPMIADLGLARAVEKADNMTIVGQVLGTPTYMAPEQARGNPDIDIRADIYSLGVTLFSSLTGRVPFKGESVYDTVAQVLYEPVPNPRDYVPTLCDETVAIINRAMAKKREERYSTPEDFLAALRAARSAAVAAKGGTKAASKPTAAPTAPAPGQPQPPASPPAHQPTRRVYRGIVIDDGTGEEKKAATDEGSSSSFSQVASWLKELMNTKKPEDQAGEGAEDPNKGKKKRVFRGQVYYDE